MPKPALRLVILIAGGAAVLGLAAAGLQWYAAATDESSAAAPVIRKPTQPLMTFITEDPEITVSLPVDAGGKHPPATPVPYRELLDERDRWFAGHVIAATRKAADGAPWQEDAAAWMLDAWRLILGHPAAPEKQALVERGRALLADGCADPAVLALQGMIHPELPAQLDLLRRCLPGLEKGAWSPALRAMVHDRLALSRKPADPVHLTRILGALEAARDAGDFADDAGGAVLLAIVRDIDDELDPYASRVANRLADGRGMPAWTAATLHGRMRISLAWRSRGSGWANSVTEEGWRGFHQELALARTALEAGAALAPNRSEPRVSLLTVILGEGKEDAAARIQEQFARVQEVSPDHLAACSVLIGALRPRWLGDSQTMFAQGMTWAGSTDYGGYLPWAGLEALRDLDRDLDLSGVVYLQAGVPETFDRVAAGYLASPQPLIPARTLHALAFRAGFLGGRYAQALAHWRAMDGIPTENLAADPRLAMRFVEGMCELGARYETPEVKALIKAPEATADGKLVERLLAAPDLPPGCRAWLEHLQAIAGNRLRFARGETLVLPGSAGLGGWQSLNGRWSAEAGALAVDSGYLGHLLPLSVPVGDRFVLSGRVKIVSTSNGTWQAGVVFGHPKAHVDDARGWGSVRFTPTREGGVEAQISDGFMQAREARSTTVPDPRDFAFRFELRDGHCTVSVDGRTVLDQVALPRAADMDRDAVVGLGAYMSDNQVLIRYSELRLSREEQRAESGGAGVPP